MKKMMPYALLFLGLGLGIFSITQGWAGLELPIAGITMKMLGYEFLQGKLAAVGLLLAAILFFVKPKFAGLGGLLAILAGAWMMASPPTVEGVEWKTEKIVYAVMVAGLLMGLAGMMGGSAKSKNA
jgi:hypothetical protein